MAGYCQIAILMGSKTVGVRVVYSEAYFCIAKYCFAEAMSRNLSKSATLVIS